MLLDTEPFQLLRLSAPKAQDSERLSLEIEAKTDTNGKVTLSSIAGFSVAAGTVVTLYDLAPAVPVDPATKLAAPPIAGPSFSVCDPAQPWETSPMAATSFTGRCVTSLSA